jgi:serine/threonine-protein kinase HipA
VFSDTAPDRWGRKLIERTEAATAREERRTARSFSEADYLLGVRDDLCQGALRYRRAGGEGFLATEDTGVPALLQLGTLLNAAEALERDDPTSQQLRLLLRGGSSLGGARPKAHVIGTDGRPAIAKFPSPKHDDWDVIRWEYVALELARQAGLTTADHQLERVDGKPVIILRRFDRRAAGKRIGYISAMTLLSAGDGQTFDYLDIAQQIEADSDRATEDLRELWTRAAYGRLISNTDDHLRNHGSCGVPQAGGSHPRSTSTPTRGARRSQPPSPTTTPAASPRCSTTPSSSAWTPTRWRARSRGSPPPPTNG